MRLYLIRHGQTRYNAEFLHQHGKVGLSDIGIAQAQVLAKRFSKIPVDVIYSSPLKRAKETAEIINKNLKKKIIYSDFLKEKRNSAEIIGKKSDSDEIQKIHRLMGSNSDDPLWHYSDEENFSEFKERAIKFFDILDKIKEENILAVTHGGPIRILILSMAFGKDISAKMFEEFKFTFRPDNTGITFCEKKNDKWIVRTFNDYSHLG